MRVNHVLGTYVAMERTPSLGGGVMASGPTAAVAIMRCMVRKAAAYQGKVVMFDEPNPVRALRVACKCVSDSCESVTQLLLPAAKLS